MVSTGNMQCSVEELRRKIDDTELALACAESVFNASRDDAVTESAIYRILSLSVYRDHLYSEARQNLLTKD